MDFKNIVKQVINEEEWRARNTRDIEGLKRIQRKIVKEYSSGNKFIPKQEAILIAKETNPDEKKKFVRYINNIYKNDNKLDYLTFVNRMVKEGIQKGEGYKIVRPNGFEEIQVLKKAENIGVNVIPKLKEILIKYSEEYPVEVNDLLEKISFTGHFEDTASFLRYNKVTPKWIHISAAQTDFFNNVRKYASDNKNKKLKKMFSEILALEDDIYKALFSKLIAENPKTKIFTFNTMKIAKSIERMESKNKAYNIYSILPKKLGFRLKPITRGSSLANKLKEEDEDFFNRIYKIEKENLWYANKNMVNEETLSEMAIKDLTGINSRYFEEANFIEIRDQYYQNMRERAISAGKPQDYYFKKSSLASAVSRKKDLIKALREKYEVMRPELFIINMMNAIDFFPSISESGFETNLNSLSNRDLVIFFKFLSRAKYKKHLNFQSSLAEFYNKVHDVDSFLKEIKNGNYRGLKEILKNNKDTVFLSCLKDKNYTFPFLKALASKEEYSEEFLSFLKKVINYKYLAPEPFFLNCEEFLFVYRRFRDIKQSSVKYSSLFELARKKDFNCILKKEPETQNFLLPKIKDLKNLASFLKGTRIGDKKVLETCDIYKNLSLNQKKELLKKSGFSKEEINSIVPNNKITKKEKDLSKRLLGEDLDFFFKELKKIKVKLKA